MQIAIDTSNDIASIALTQGGEINSEMTWRCGQNHTVELYSRLDFLIRKSGWDWPQADCIFVAIGPGSFNGLRVGVSAAKGLALSLGIPVIGIGTLEISAFQHASSSLPICVVQNAGREEVAAAFYRNLRSGWKNIKPEELMTIETLMTKIKGTTIFCGDFDAATSAQIKKLGKGRAVIPPGFVRLRRAGLLAGLGLRRFEKGLIDDASTLQPVYLRKPPVTERKKA